MLYGGGGGHGHGDNDSSDKEQFSLSEEMVTTFLV